MVLFHKYPHNLCQPLLRQGIRLCAAFFSQREASMALEAIFGVANGFAVAGGMW